MTPKQRFEKKLSNLFIGCDEPIENLDSVMQVRPSAVLKLLLAEHRHALVIVRRQRLTECIMQEACCPRCYARACDDILHALTGQKKEEQP